MKKKIVRYNACSYFYKVISSVLQHGHIQLYLNENCQGKEQTLL